MKEAYAITGFLPTAVASKLSDRAVESVDVLIDKKSDTVVRVATKDIAEVRMGPASKGMTGVQLILREKIDVDVVGKLSTKKGVEPLLDPILGRLSNTSIVTRIYV